MANMTFKANLLPNTDLGYNLGSSDLRWNIYGNLTGNAATATKLQTARTINGTDFNGTVNITTANWGTARTLTIGNTGKSVNGSANVSWSKAEIIGSGSTANFLRGDHAWTNELISASTTDAGGNILRLRTTATIASGYQYGVNHLVPNLTGSSNSNTVMLTGVANSAGNQGYIGFHYVGAANNGNWVSLGIYGKDHLIKAFYTGYIATSGTTQFSNTTSWNGGTAIIGADGKDKAIIGYCNSSTNGVVFGAHASSCTAWAPVNLSGTQINFRNSETLVGKFLDGCLRLYGNMHQQCLEVTRGTAYNGNFYRTSPEWTDSAGTRLA